jgi:hypothetical protein
VGAGHLGTAGEGLGALEGVDVLEDGASGSEHRNAACVGRRTQISVVISEDRGWVGGWGGMLWHSFTHIDAHEGFLTLIHQTSPSAPIHNPVSLAAARKNMLHAGFCAPEQFAEGHSRGQGVKRAREAG